MAKTETRNENEARKGLKGQWVFYLVLICLAVGIAVGVIVPRKISGLLKPKGGEITGETIVEQIISVQKLITMEYHYKDIGKHEDTKTIIGGITNPLTSKKVLFTYQGTIHAGVDVKKIQADVDEDAKVISITLPRGEILAHEMPPEDVEIYDERTGVFSKYSFDDRNQILVEEKNRIEREFENSSYLEDARKEAEKAITALLSVLTEKEGYTLRFLYAEMEEEAGSEAEAENADSSDTQENSEAAA
ncbi:MAG: DUF4230 domain-containing protein [Oscillibacter sp.]|nr:DUF4230 domain-containing protein [Oscillibacter sp.]